MTDESRVVTFRFQLSLADLYRALLRNTLRKAWFLAIVPIAGLSTIARSVLFPAEHSNDLYSGMPLVLIGLFFFAGLPYAQARSAIKKASFRGPLEYTFSEMGIDTKGDYSRGHMDWKLVKGASETSRYVFVHVAQGCFHLIPKYQIDADQVRTLKEILRLHSPGKVRLRR